MDQLMQQFKKGVFELLVLKLLSQADCYGYQLIQLLAEQSKGAFALKEGTLYPILYRLEDQGLVESYWSEDDPSHKRAKRKKYYHITHTGQEKLRHMMVTWLEFERDVNQVLRSEKTEN